MNLLRFHDNLPHRSLSLLHGDNKRTGHGSLVDGSVFIALGGRCASGAFTW